MIKRASLPITSLLAIVFLLSACASPNEVMTEEASSRSAAPVPGERLPDEGTVTPGTGGPSAGVRW
jgi:hypothetical protein